jgi:hypothetical protein
MNTNTSAEQWKNMLNLRQSTILLRQHLDGAVEHLRDHGLLGIVVEGE